MGCWAPGGVPAPFGAFESQRVTSPLLFGSGVGVPFPPLIAAREARACHYMMLANGQDIRYLIHMERLKDRVFQMRASDGWLARLDDWRRQQTEIPSRAEAIRILVEAGIEALKVDETHGLPPRPAKQNG